jgi:hypothetical protein
LSSDLLKELEEDLKKEPTYVLVEENGLWFYKEDKNLIIWDVESDEYGPYYFSFDKKIIFNFWTDYPNKLTKEQIEIFKREKPIMAKLRPC